MLEQIVETSGRLASRTSRGGERRRRKPAAGDEAAHRPALPAEHVAVGVAPHSSRVPATGCRRERRRSRSRPAPCSRIVGRAWRWRRRWARRDLPVVVGRSLEKLAGSVGVRPRSFDVARLQPRAIVSQVVGARRLVVKTSQFVDGERQLVLVDRAQIGSPSRRPPPGACWRRSPADRLSPARRSSG
jgi:hypothetical protein